MARKRRSEQLQKIGEAISKIGEGMQDVSVISVETFDYKVSVSSKKKSPLSRIPAKALLYFASISLFGISINLLSDSITLIPNIQIKSLLTLVILILGMLLGCWEYLKSRYS